MLRTVPAVFAALAIACLTGADWLQFRGNDANGVAESPVPPDQIDQVAWKVSLPGRGLSGPTVVGDQVVLSASSGFNDDRLHVLSFDAATGEQQWERQFWATGRTQCHQKMCVATPQIASDGERLFAFYSSNDLVCLDLEGNLLWYRGLGADFPNASNSLGMSSSPLVVGNTVIVQVESDAEAFSMGVNVENGLTRWKIDRPRASNWTSPALLRKAEGDRDLVLLQSREGLAAVRPETGETVW
ncbi:MAG: PQQ-binding-like beta-propeller repeat protein, partial [Planctomycetaceae bacterium]|nr:PQQ-binding-like beta-propeller repeat protein [Planctomycetaceae bacterium]